MNGSPRLQPFFAANFGSSNLPVCSSFVASDGKSKHNVLSHRLPGRFLSLVLLEADLTFKVPFPLTG